MAATMCSAVLLLATLAHGEPAAQPQPPTPSGSLCVAAAKQPDKIAGDPLEQGYTVQVDAHPELPLSYTQSISHPPLELDRRHLVRIRKNGRVVQSFYFRYDDHTTQSVCVFFEPYYAVWKLWPAEGARYICKCGTSSSERK